MRPVLSLVAILPGLLATGCATTPYQAKVPSEDLICVEGIAAVTRHALQSATPLSASSKSDSGADAYVEFADLAQCYLEDGERRVVVVYALDAIDPPAEIAISALLSAGGSFAASAQLLDAQFQPLRRYGFDQFIRRGEEYSLSVFLNEPDREATYLLLAADRDQVGKTDTTVGAGTSQVMVPVGAGMFAFNHGFETSVSRPLLSGGRLRVLVKPHRAGAAF